MILTRDIIQKEIDDGRIRISPFDEDALGPASLDLTLGDTIRVYPEGGRRVPVKEGTDFHGITERREIQEGYVMRPGELVLGITREHITLPPDICGWLNSRSRFARLGLMVHITSPFMQPGIANHQVLEIYNASPYDLELMPGERLCQFVFQYCEGQAEYKGRYREQAL